MRDTASANEELSAQVHIHLDLDSEIGLQQARSLLQGILAPLGAHLPIGPAAGPVLPPAPVAGPSASPAAVMGPLAAPAASPLPAMPASMAAPPNIDMLQHLMQLGTPARRRGRPSRAETELRALLNSAVASSAAPARVTIPCKICTQPKADTLLRQCGHAVCRMCVVPYLSLRQVCPIANCGLPTTLQDLVNLNL